MAAIAVGAGAVEKDDVCGFSFLLQYLLVASSSSFSSISLYCHSSVDIIRGAASWIPKVSSFGGCAAVVGIFNGVEN